MAVWPGVTCAQTAFPSKGKSVTSRERKIVSVCFAIMLSLVIAVMAATLKGGSGGTVPECIAYGAGAFVSSFGVCMLVLMFLLA
ncbi:hypothetical protein ACFWBH_03600 [Streptomyces sp. NPDC059999]|uniref:hypothetical protein n=1 Tax=Streptomyces sp. NPDC059999 TaxID=3347030 RepID=UPI0036924D19